ncbi:uncharacterized protein LOC142375644 [Odontesthes bonariensis]|uniref:uncharacterized protein LOC142375644 n=1 Tax=Odontesthes bonariensis TaxID=219752 RepID=UPI003F582722
MVTFRWIKMSLFLILMLQFTAAAVGQSLHKLTVRVGDDVSLPCYSVTRPQQNCESSTWMFSYKMGAVTLFEHGQIHREAAAKSDRLSVTANCSLVIKKVTDEDDGRYTCRQFISGEQGPDSEVDLSVINSKDEKTTKSEFVTSAPKTTATTKLTTTTTSLKTSKTTTTSKASVTRTKHRTSTTTTKRATKTSADKQTSTTKNPSQQQRGQPWWVVIVSVGVAVFLIVGVVIIIWKKTKGNERKKEENPADPEVSYASIRYTKNTKKKSQDPDTVIYSTVRASSSSAGVSIDPNSIYITINEPK